MNDSDSFALTTPERVDLRFDVAGLGSRFAAAFVDTAIQFTAIIALIIAAAIAERASGFVLSRLLSNELRQAIRQLSLGSELIGALVVLLIFVLYWGYYLLFEAIWSGQTPGKRMMGIRVLTTGGLPVTFSHVLVRNLVRIVDFLPVFYGLGALVILVNSRSQRLGDLAAGTFLVKERRDASPRRLVTPPSLVELPPQQASAFSAEDVAVARAFLLRRADLRPERQQELAERLAARLRSRLGPGVPEEPAEMLLERIAAIKR
jgi:uncharacterized RDD family membrane protein YckC